MTKTSLDTREPRRRNQKAAVTAGRVAHELNDALTLVLGYSQLIMDNTRKTDKNRYFAEQILEAGALAAVLSRELLAVGGARKLDTWPSSVNAKAGAVGLAAPEAPAGHSGSSPELG